MPTIASLQKGEKGIITEFSVDLIPLKLLEMGCTPGEKIMVERKAPFNDPIAIVVSGFMLSLRKEDAEKIIVKQL